MPRLPKHIDPKNDSLKSANRFFQILIYGSLTFSILLIFLPIFGTNLELTVPTDQGETLVELETFSLTEKGIFSCLYSLTIFAWIVGLLSLLKLSKNFSKGEIYTKTNTRRVKIFAYSLLAIAVLDPVHEVIAAHFLIARGHLDASSSVNPIDFINQLDYIVSATLILLICIILNRAAEISEEAELTI